MNDWQDFEHRLWQILVEWGLTKSTFLVGLSGGVDSVALVLSLQRVAPGRVFAAHVHHGVHENTTYRDAAQEFCVKFCSTHQVPLTIVQNTEAALVSEQALRNFRREQLRKIQVSLGADCLALGHHEDDLLETRMMRLIRGTGSQGLHSMQVYEPPLFRPFLRTNKADLERYVQARKGTYLTDPTNFSQDPFRNWLRESWLRDLEQRQPGATKALARSLETLSVELKVDARGGQDVFLKTDSLPVLSRPFFLALTRAEQIRTLAQAMLMMGRRDYSQGQLEEIKKRLDNSENEFTFKVAGVSWSVNAQQIRVQDSN